eukprot:scaffold300_cov72-Skeletonema_dohrnii-CCMP3373.AAC.3
MGYSHPSSSSASLKALVGSCLPLFLTFAICLSIVLVTQNKRRMRRRGRWQPTKRFLPVLSKASDTLVKLQQATLNNTLIIVHYVQVINKVSGHEGKFSANDLISATDVREIKMIRAAPEWESQCQHKTYQRQQPLRHSLLRR